MPEYQARRISRRRLSRLTAVVAMTAALSLVAGNAVAAPSNQEWIRSLALPDGTIARDVQPWMNGYPTYVNPYWSNWGAIGLARAAAGPADLRIVWDWLTWYQDHMNGSGSVRNRQILWDFSTDPATYTVDVDPIDEYFSTAGNAGTFLMALQEAYGASGDLPKLSEYSFGLEKAVSVIADDMHPDGLAWQSPKVRTKLLMDQAEAYAGLRAAASLAGALGNNALAASAKDSAVEMKDGVDTLWDRQSGLYYKEKAAGKTLVPTTWNQYYMDSTAQAWLAALSHWSPGPRLVGMKRARALTETFGAVWPEWSKPHFSVPAGDPRVTGTGDGEINYWPILANAFIDSGMDTVAAAGLDEIEAEAANTDRIWPFTVGHAGQIAWLRAQ